MKSHYNAIGGLPIKSSEEDSEEIFKEYSKFNKDSTIREEIAVGSVSDNDSIEDIETDYIPPQKPKKVIKKRKTPVKKKIKSKASANKKKATAPKKAR